jgi:hypothetical protein
MVWPVKLGRQKVVEEELHFIRYEMIPLIYQLHDISQEETRRHFGT